ncbi:MAG: hypothetical protein GY749_23080 [Desulfobacteraceae bacterium]|nr:hypothetical protein [Desulfobacteraceae bacterium]
MKRDIKLLNDIRDPYREASELPLGPEGAYFVGGEGEPNISNGKNPSIISYNTPPNGQPGLYCLWKPSDDGTAIETDGSNDPYNYIEWLNYIIKHFLKPWGYVLNGEVSCIYNLQLYSEKLDDDFDYREKGKIVVKNNEVSNYFVGKEVWDEDGNLINDFDFTVFEGDRS